MIKLFSHWVANHTYIIVIISGFIMAPFTYFAVDSLKHPERYNHK